MLPSLQLSRLFALYYIPFMLLFTFLLIPIPLAIVYEGFKQNRVAIQIIDQNKRNAALKTCFDCLKEGDIIPVKQLHQFFHTMYIHHLNDQEQDELQDLIGDEAITFPEFEQLYKIIDSICLYSIDRIPTLQIWIQIRIFFEQKYQLRKHLETTKFALIILLLVTINCSFIIASFFIYDQEVLDTFDIIDKVFFGIYSIELLLKVFFLLIFIIQFIAFGIYEFFEDGQNTFDFFLVMFQFIFDFILINAISSQFSSTVKVNRIFRLTKIQKVFRVFRAVRTIRILQVVFIGLDIFNKVKDLIIKIIQCIPIVSKFVAILWIVLYVYSSIGVEVFSGHFNESRWEKSTCTDRRYSQDQEMVPGTVDWSSCTYTDFRTFQDALLLLLQIFLQANWGWYLFDYSYKIDNYFGTALYFQSFMFFGIFQNALISGLVWEVFNQVKEEEDLLEEVDEVIESPNNLQVKEASSKTEKQVKFNENDDFRQIFQQIEENIDSNDNHEIRISWRENRNFSITKLKTEKNVLIGSEDRMKVSENQSAHDSIQHFGFKPLEELIEDGEIQQILEQDKYEKQVIEEVRDFFIDSTTPGIGSSKGQIPINRKKNIQREQYVSIVLYNLSQIMSVQSTTSQTLIQILIQIENIISRQLLVKGSYIKFLFKSKNQWFTVSQENSWKIIELGPGPWSQFSGNKQLFQYGQLDEDEWQDTLDQIREISVNHRYAKMAFLNQLVILSKIEKENPELISECVLLSVLHSGEQQGKSGFKRKTKQHNSGLNFVKEEEKVEFNRYSQIEGLELIKKLYIILKENSDILFKKLEQFIQIREEVQS